MRKKTINDHFADNSHQKIDPHALGKQGLIIHQHRLDNFRYGKHSADYNGCGCIAIYNTFRLLGVESPPTMAEIIREMESNNRFFRGSILNGHLGSWPWTPKHVLAEWAIPTKAKFYLPPFTKKGCEKYFNRWEERSAEADVNILMYGDRTFRFAHFVVYHTTDLLDDGQQVYQFYNDSGKEFATLKEFNQRTLGLKYHLQVFAPA